MLGVLDDMATQLTRALPPQVGEVRAELHQNFRAILQTRLAELGMVSREEFEASQAMLAQTRAKLEALERKVAELEAGSD